MFQRGDRVVWLDWVMGITQPSDYAGTVLYSYAIWNAPTMRSDSYNPYEDWRFARYVIRWDSGLTTKCEREADLALAFEGI